MVNEFYLGEMLGSADGVGPLYIGWPPLSLRGSVQAAGARVGCWDARAVGSPRQPDGRKT
jgi:hypothetical protein